MSKSLSLRAAAGTALIVVAALASFQPQAALAQAASEPAATQETAAAPAAPAPMAPVVEKEVVENPFGLAGMWAASDQVKRGTLVILAIMSVWSWYVLFVKFFETRGMLKSGREGSEKFWQASSVKAGLAELKEGSALHYIASQGVKAADHHEGTMAEAIDKHTWIGMSIERALGSVQSRLSDGMSLLATVGSTAPFVGLFGTTWGIYNALVEIGLSGQASIDRVAGPVGAALILTAVGLAVAVPAVMGYNWLIRRNKVVMDSVRTFGADVNAVLTGGK